MIRSHPGRGAVTVQVQLVLRAFGGGYTALAMVADSHPIAHPPQTSAKVRRLALLESAAHTEAKMTAQTMAQPMLYAV
jgi:hypothetical protein